MFKPTIFVKWFLFFVMPLSLSMIDIRFFAIVMGFLITEIWRTMSHFFGGEWVPTPDFIVDKMLKTSGVKRNDVLYDLGSGDGKIILKAAKSAGKTIGIEIDPLRVLISRIRIKLSNLNNVKVIQDNFYKINVRNADVVTLFLLPKTMERIENKLRKELRKGARIVSYRFVFKNWKPIKIDETNKIYLYKV